MAGRSRRKRGRRRKVFYFLFLLRTLSFSSVNKLELTLSRVSSEMCYKLSAMYQRSQIFDVTYVDFKEEILLGSCHGLISPLCLYDESEIICPVILDIIHRNSHPSLFSCGRYGYTCTKKKLLTQKTAFILKIRLIFTIVFPHKQKA